MKMNISLLFVVLICFLPISLGAEKTSPKRLVSAKAISSFIIGGASLGLAGYLNYTFFKPCGMRTIPHKFIPIDLALRTMVAHKQINQKLIEGYVILDLARIASAGIGAFSLGYGACQLLNK